ncbi:MAG: hypothetical protein L0170_18350 [Acidobacteria bacterium]|nr:hypothetical protein [Acidobacteriota bacterium]
MLYIRASREQIQELLQRQFPKPTKVAKKCQAHIELPLTQRPHKDCPVCWEDICNYLRACSSANQFMAQWKRDAENLLVTTKEIGCA